MIIGTYPKMVTGNHFGNEINTTADAVGRWIPGGCCLHILPPFDSAGDYGFAPNSILEIDTALGTWIDIRNLSQKYRIILDGIFNHVGIHSNVFPHPADCEGQCSFDYFFAFPKADIDPNMNLSTRGGSVFRSSFVSNGREYVLWQTFSDTSVDLRLDNEKVQSYIKDFIDLCVKNHVWGIRLDAVAYYYKEPGVAQLHHPKAKRYAHAIADKFLDCGIYVLAQLDSDLRGQAYYPPDKGYTIPICDYAYTAYLLYTQLSGNAERLAQYLIETEECPYKLLRTPRNHDGILLRPRQFDENTKNALLRLCKHYHIPVRISNGTPYEINSSFPYLCKLCSASVAECVARNHSSILLTALQIGVPYLYFPQLVGYMPELRTKTFDEGNDPRGLNRIPIDQDYLNDVVVKLHNQQLVKALALIENRLKISKDGQQKVSLIGAGCLMFTREDIQMSLLINFSHKANCFLDAKLNEGRRCICSSTNEQGILEPGDYILIDTRGVEDAFRGTP